MEKIKKLVQKHKETVHLREQYFNSAILICLIEEEGIPYFILEKRAATLKRQPGEICFPGGKIEKEEWENPIKTAIRETIEELGVQEEDIEIFGAVNHLVNSAGLLVYSYIGKVNSKASFFIQKQEVERIIKIPVSFFIKNPPSVHYLQVTMKPKENFPMDKIPSSYKETWEKRKADFPIYFYQYEEEVIWGLTASLIYECINLFFIS